MGISAASLTASRPWHTGTPAIFYWCERALANLRTAPACEVGRAPAPFLQVFGLLPLWPWRKKSRGAATTGVADPRCKPRIPLLPMNGRTALIPAHHLELFFGASPEA